MRTDKEVRDRLEELVAKRLAKRKSENLSRCPKNCVFNRAYRIAGKGEVRLCGNGKVLASIRKPCFVCSTDETAIKCKEFETNKTEEEIEKEFHDILRDPARCGHAEPKLAILIWFLQKFDSSAFQQDEGGRWDRLKNIVKNLIYLRWW